MGRRFLSLCICMLFFGVAAQAVPINVALNKPTTSFGPIYDGRVADRAVDGDWGTLWTTAGIGSVATPYGMVVDLEGTFDLDEIILGEFTSGIYFGYTKEYVLEYSDGTPDGSGGLIWTLIADDFIEDQPQTTPGEIPPYGPFVDVWDLSSTVENASFVRLSFDGGSHWSGVAELMVMAEPAGAGPGAAIPEPATLSLLGLGALAAWRRKRKQ